MRNTQTRANPASRKQLRESLQCSAIQSSRSLSQQERGLLLQRIASLTTHQIFTLFGEGVATFGEGAYTPKLLIDTPPLFLLVAVVGAASNRLSNNLQSSLSTCCIQFAEHSVQCNLQSSLSTARERAPLRCGAYDIILSKNERRI
jgi:hypothetical protein